MRNYKIEKKILYFDYFISRIIYKLFDNNNQKIDPEFIRKNILNSQLNRLKLLKLLFLVSAIPIDGDYTLLDNVFTNFYAMPYGPVESDIYNHIGQLDNFIVENKKIDIKRDASFVYPNDEYTAAINNAINYICDKNNRILQLSAFDLVELTHKTEVWKIVFAEAQRNGLNSLHMRNELIKKSTIYFS